MKMIYIVCNEIQNCNNMIGVRKKVKMQMDAFQRKGYEPIYVCFDSYRLYIQEQTGEKRVSMTYYSRPHQCVDALIEYIRKAAPKLVYMRYSVIWGEWVEYFYSELGQLDTKAICEFPTYPYDSEIPEGNKLKYCDIYYRENLKNHFKISTNFQGHTEIFGIKSIGLCNGIDKKIPLHAVKEKNGLKEINMIAVANVSFWHGLDRFIEGMNQYINVERNTEWKLYLHIVGEGPESVKLRKMVEGYNLGENIIFYGKISDAAGLNALFDGKDIGIGSIGMHRHTKNMKASPIKSSEYCMRGLPFIIGYDDISFDNDYPYILHVEKNDDPIPMHEVIEFYKKYANVGTAQEMREYAIQNLTWDAAVEKLINALN